MIEVTQDYIKNIFPKRPKDSHKGTFGSVLTIASSAKYTGAGYLCAKAASISGCGYSTIAVPKSLANIYRSLDPEILVIPLVESKGGNLCPESLKDIELEKFSAVAIGGGIDTQPETIQFIKCFFDKCKDSQKSFIVDADAINCLSKSENFNLPENSLITPHKKEFERLSKDSLSESCQKFKTTILLKGHQTKISDGQNVWQNTTGCSALAKAGSGDILTGIIAGLCAQNLNITNAAIAGAYLHGLASEVYASDENEYSMTMKDLLEYLPKAITRIVK